MEALQGRTTVSIGPFTLKIREMAHPLLLRGFPQTWTCYLHPLGVPTHLPCPIISAQSPRTLLEVTSQIVDYKLAIALKAKSLITGYTDIGGERANSYHVWFRK